MNFSYFSHANTCWGGKQLKCFVWRIGICISIMFLEVVRFTFSYFPFQGNFRHSVLYSTLLSYSVVSLCLEASFSTEELGTKQSGRLVLPVGWTPFNPWLYLLFLARQCYMPFWQLVHIQDQRTTANAEVSTIFFISIGFILHFRSRVLDRCVKTGFRRPIINWITWWSLWVYVSLTPQCMFLLRDG